jgi:hypothetical protein
VNIIDDTNGITAYSILNPVEVLPNPDLVSLFTITSSNKLLMSELNSGNINVVLNNALSLSSGFNEQFNSSQSLSQTSQIAGLKELLVNKVTQLNVGDSNSISTITSALSSLTQVPEQVSSNMAVRIINYREKKKSISQFNYLNYAFFFHFFKSLAMVKTSELINTIQSTSNQMTISQLQQVFSGCFSTIANSLIVNKFLNKS